MNRRTFLLGVSAVLATTGPGFPQSAIPCTMYKNPNCGCCDVYADYLRPLGFAVSVQNTVDLIAIKREAGVPEALYGCHTLLVDEYVVEGLVPVEILRRLLRERPLIAGLSLPGMPVGVPGMPGERTGLLEVYSFGLAGPQVYAVV